MAELINVFEHLHWNPVFVVKDLYYVHAAHSERLLIHGVAPLDPPRGEGALILGHEKKTIWERDIHAAYSRWRTFEMGEFGSDIQAARDALRKKWHELEQMHVERAAGHKEGPSLGLLEHCREELRQTTLSLSSFYAACTGPMHTQHLIPPGGKLVIKIPDQSPHTLRVMLVLSRIREVGQIKKPERKP